jgi:hypothetical protein
MNALIESEGQVYVLISQLGQYSRGNMWISVLIQKTRIKHHKIKK